MCGFFFFVRATGNIRSAQFEASGRGQADPVPDPQLFTVHSSEANKFISRSLSGDTETDYVKENVAFLVFFCVCFNLTAIFLACKWNEAKSHTIIRSEV